MMNISPKKEIRRESFSNEMRIDLNDSDTTPTRQTVSRAPFSFTCPRILTFDTEKGTLTPELPKSPSSTFRSSLKNLTSDTSFSVGQEVVAVFDYKGTNNEEIAVEEGEKILILQPGNSIIYNDNGTGWTVVAKSGAAGVVPTSYLQAYKQKINSESTLDGNVRTSGVKILFIKKAIYPFKKNTEEELSLNEGDSVNIIEPGIFIFN
jgi:hypothetical protein